ncbi:MAG: putative transrane anti-sigma factor [Actinobacteria bacterium]|nr:putative transrane anti-sigma factor [Actinomycetota bacterium]
MKGNMRMECERIQDLLSDFLDGSLPDSGRAGVSAHLLECRGCSAAAEGLKNTIGLLRTLPPDKAPAELLERIRRETARGAPAKPLWKKMFLPAHVKIPIEAAAAILLFMLVYGIQKGEFPGVAPPLPTARMETAIPGTEKAAVPEAAPSRAAAAPRRVARAPEAEQGGRDAKVFGGKSDGPTGGAEPRREPSRGAAVPGHIAAAPSPPALPHAQPALPTVPAQRASTSAETIRPASPREEKSLNGAPIRLFAAPPSRLMRPVPHGREVTLEIAARDRAGLEDRISAAALRLGGTVIREPVTGAADMPANAHRPDSVRVRLPADSTEPFLAGLRNLGTIPPGESAAWADLPAGPTTWTVLYTVRIRVR